MNISYFFRAPGINFSIERVFNTILLEVSRICNVNKIEMPYYFPAVINIIRNLYYAFKSSSEINHITGDINYVAMVLPHKGLVLTIHDTVLLENSKGIKRFLYKYLWYIIPIRRSQIVTCISNQTKNRLLGYFPWAKNKIKIIYNPVDTSYKYHNKVFNDNCPIILFIGTRENKNIYRAIEALNGINCHLRIIGETTQKMRESLTSKNINYSEISKISDNNMVLEYQNCDMVLFPSIFEGFGMPIIEAQATGRIVVTSNIEPMIEVSDHSAFLVNPFEINSIRDGVLEAIHNKEKRETLIIKGLKNVERFTSNNIAKQYLDIYKSLQK